MSLLYPQFLWALVLNVIPLIIHLFNLQKHETIYFSDISLLKDIEQETKRLSNFKNILIMLLRMLLISSIVIAFCFPYNNKNSSLLNADNGTIGIYLDNSFSMQRSNNKLSLIENAKDDIMKLVDKYPENTKFILTTNIRKNNHYYPITKSDLIKEITKIEGTSKSLDYSEIITIQNEQSKMNINSSFWFTDLHQKDFKFDNYLIDSIFPINILHYQSINNNNISIDSVWFSEKIRKINKVEELNIKLSNYSKNDVEFLVKLTINNNEVSTQIPNTIKGNETKNISINYILETKGNKNGILKIVDASFNDQIFDDKYYFTYEIDEDYRVIHLYENESNIRNPLKTLFKKIENTYYKSINVNDGYTAEELKGDLFIIDGVSTFTKELTSILIKNKYKKNNIVFIPSDRNNLDKVEILNLFDFQLSALDTSLTSIREESIYKDFFKSVFNKKEKNIDLPYFKKSFNLNSSISVSKVPLIYLENSYPLIVKNEFKGNKLFLFTTPLNLENSNLTNHPLFVPIFLKIKEICSNDRIKQFEISNIPEIEIKNYNKINGPLIIEDKNDLSNFSFYPIVKTRYGKSMINCGNQIDNDGHYFININDSLISSFGVNYGRDESNMSFFNPVQIKSIIENSNLKDYIFYSDLSNENSDVIFSKNQNDDYLWKYFIILGLIFIVLEITLIKLTENNVI